MSVPSIKRDLEAYNIQEYGRRRHMTMFRKWSTCCLTPRRRRLIHQPRPSQRFYSPTISPHRESLEPTHCTSMLPCIKSTRSPLTFDRYLVHDQRACRRVPRTKQKSSPGASNPSLPGPTGRMALILLEVLPCLVRLCSRSPFLASSFEPSSTPRSLLEPPPLSSR
jgi:hypothetical protein